jgi:hypothetical protein
MASKTERMAETKTVESIYPKIATKTESVDAQITVNDLLESKLSRTRAAEIINKQKELEKDRQRYKKLIKKYKRAANILKALGLGVAIVIAATGSAIAIITTQGVAIPIAIPIAVSVIGGIEAAITQSVLFAYINKKVHRFREKYDTVNTYLNRLYIFYHKSIEDKKISVEEMEEFHKLTNEYETEINKLNSGIHSATENIHLSKLDHLAEQQALREVEDELISKRKEEKKNELKAKFHLNLNAAAGQSN